VNQPTQKCAGRQHGCASAEPASIFQANTGRAYVPLNVVSFTLNNLKLRD
jgi:hypothetical protein